MALRGIEGWDGYAVGLSYSTFENIFDAKWDLTLWMDQSRIASDDDHYVGEKTWESTQFDEAWVCDLSDNPEEVACGLYFKNKWSGLNRSGTYPLFGINNNSASHIQVNYSGRDLQIRLSNNGVSDATIHNVLEPTRWNLVELKAKVHDTTGYWYLYVNGVEVGSNTGIDTKYSTYNVDQVRIYGYQTYYDYGDFYCCDLTGSKNNDVLGAFHIQGILPDANGDDSDWTPSANASNYTMVNEETANESNYVESGTANQQDLYNYEDLTGTWDEIFGIQINTRIYMDASANETVAVVCSSNGTEDSANFTANNTDIQIGDEAQFRRILEDDPDTSNAWASANIDSAQFGVKFI